MTAIETVIQLRTEVARLMGGGAGCGETTATDQRQKRDLDDELARLGVSLRPLHPDIEDAEMASYFTLVEAEGLEDEQVLAALRDLDAVSAAYAKPLVEPA